MINETNKIMNNWIQIIYLILLVLFLLPMRPPHYSDRIANIIGGLGYIGFGFFFLICTLASIMLFIWYMARVSTLRKKIEISKELEIQLISLSVILIITVYLHIDLYTCGYTIGF